MPPTVAAATRAIHDVYPLGKDVLRVLCPKSGVPVPGQFSAGTGFVHKDVVITAAHVVADCAGKDVKLVIAGKLVGVVEKFDDAALDLAILRPTPDVMLGPGLDIMSGADQLSIGDTVVWLGYPSGYDTLTAYPMLGVGYLAAVAPFQAAPNVPARGRAFVNGAFNHGNSGGPVIDPQTQRVVGVVDAKMMPLPPVVTSALAVLAKEPGGMQYTATTPDGHQVALSEAQVVAAVLNHLEEQVQLVVGVMVLPGDLHAFLSAHGVD